MDNRFSTWHISFFLTPRALYLLVVDDRRELVNIDYWFNVIHLLGEGSPVVVVQNQKNFKASSSFDLDINTYIKRYKNDFHIESHTIDLAQNDERFNRLRQRLYDLVSRLDHIGTQLPVQWISIRKSLEEIQDSNHISLKKYFDICNRHGLTEEQDQLVLSSYLHAIGVMLHFQNSDLQDFVILNPKWAMNAVYSVLSDKKIIQSNGVFSRIWFNSYLQSKGYDHSEQVRLLHLMKKDNFEICYGISEKGDEFLAPQLLRKTKPNLDDVLEPMDITRMLRYRYSFMPKGIISRAIVRLSEYIYQYSHNANDPTALIWQKGGVFKHTNGSVALVEEKITIDKGLKVIDVSVTGASKNEVLEFFYIIKNEIDEIHRKSFKRIGTDLMVPCLCNTCVISDKQHFFEVSYLKDRIESNKKRAECKFKPFHKTAISKLTEGIDYMVRGDKRNMKKIFISYSREDEVYKDELKKHLTTLSRLNQIEIWDDQDINAGSEWEPEIFDNLKESDIILLLISPDFIASEFCYTRELQNSLELHGQGKCTIVPVIIRTCSWKKLPFGKFGAVPKNGKAISTWDDKDAAYHDVVSKIEEIL